MTYYTMITLSKSIEYYQDNKYRDLPYGTIYFVAGTASKIINTFARTQLEEIVSKINSNINNWITCKFVYLEPENPLFDSRRNAALYSAILPTDKTPEDSVNIFSASLNITDNKLLERVIEEYFFTLQQLLDEILDSGNYDKSHLTTTILSPTDQDNVLFSISRDYDSGIRFSITGNKCTPLPYTTPSRLIITPGTYRVQLSDYNLEIHFTAQVKALYVLFLNHPEGIPMNQIYDLKDEYTRLYMCFTNRSDVDRLRAGVENLFDVYNRNTIDVKKSQCNRAIREVIPNEDLQKYYVIEVHHNLPHKINLDRSLVSMPDILRR